MTKQTVNIPHNWKPRKDQAALWLYLQGGGRRAVEVAHRRWGKDDVSLHFTAYTALQHPGNYWHMLPQYNQCRKVIWDAVNPRTGKKRIDEAFPMEIRAKTRRNEMSIEFVNGAVWQLVGSDNYDAYVGSPPRGIVMSEYSISNPLAWAYLSPILEENGGWAIFIYTSRGANHGKTMFDMAQKSPAWFSQRITAYETPVFTRKQLESIEQELINIYGPELGSAMFAQEYLCSFEGAVMGAYFSSEINKARAEGRITNVPYQPGLEVDTFWDLGIDDSMSVWFMQPMGKAYHWIDYEEGTGFTMGHFAKKLKERGYVYGNHYMPHDARNRVHSADDIAKTVKQIAEGVGIKPIIITERPRSMDAVVTEQIPACRNAIAISWFDENKCKLGLAGLENYRAEYNENKKVLGTHPVHDWASHAASAFRTFVSGYKPKTGLPPGLLKPRPATRSWMAR